MKVPLCHKRLKSDFKRLVRVGRFLSPTGDGKTFLWLSEVELERESEKWACRFKVCVHASSDESMHDLGG